MTLQIQWEICIERLPLIDTEAGRLVKEDILSAREKHKQEMQHLKEEREKAVLARDQKFAKELSEAKEESERTLKDIRKEFEALEERRGRN